MDDLILVRLRQGVDPLRHSVVSVDATSVAALGSKELRFLAAARPSHCGRGMPRCEIGCSKPFKTDRRCVDPKRFCCWVAGMLESSEGGTHSEFKTIYQITAILLGELQVHAWS